jgi:hypothetical protein
MQIMSRVSQIEGKGELGKSVLSTESEHIVTDVADAHRLLQVVLENRHCPFAAARAQQSSAVAAVVLPHRQRELAAALRTELAVRPPRLTLQLVCNTRHSHSHSRRANQ